MSLNKATQLLLPLLTNSFDLILRGSVSGSKQGWAGKLCWEIHIETLDNGQVTFLHSLLVSLHDIIVVFHTLLVAKIYIVVS
jgi:hypothetical protein